eukprot:m.116404 g.116404  ORF g.116404 m.116404 type:complete len:427 (+) comp12851_c2_seq13:418-1698(+)
MCVCLCVKRNMKSVMSGSTFAILLTVCAVVACIVCLVCVPDVEAARCKFADQPNQPNNSWCHQKQYGGYCLSDCSCVGNPTHSDMFDLSCDVSVLSPATPGMWFYSIDTNNTHYNSSVEVIGGAEPQEYDEKNQTNAVGIALAPLTTRPSLLDMYGSYANNSEAIPSMHAVVGWTPCVSINQVRSTLNSVSSTGSAVVGVTWDIPTNPTFPYTDSFSFSVLFKPSTATNFTTLATAVPSTTTSFTATVPGSCDKGDFTVLLAFEHNGVTLNCTENYGFVATALSVAPQSPGQPSVDFTTLTLDTGDFSWGKVTNDGGCDDIVYTLTVYKNDDTTIVGTVDTKNTTASLTFTQELLASTDYLMEVVATNPRGVSDSVQRLFTTPAASKRSSKRKVAVGVGVSVAILCIAGMAFYVFKYQRRSRYHSI